MLTFRFTGADGIMAVQEVLTSGMIGKQVRFEFTSDWDDLQKTAVFAAGEVSRAVVNVGTVATIPAEVLAEPNQRLYVGIFGVDGSGTVVIPTIMAKGPKIKKGAEPSDDSSTDPDMPVWQQILAAIGDLNNLTTEAKSSLVMAINEAARSGGGTGSGGSSYNVYIQPEEPTDAPVGSIWVDEDENISESVVDIYDSSQNTNRQYYDTSGVLVTDVYGWYTTADMDVTNANSLIYGGLISTADSQNPRSIFKDANGGVISIFKPSKGDNDLAIPEGAATVAFTLHMNDIETFYLKAVSIGNIADGIVGAWYNKLGDRLKNLLDKATEKRICCIVDDDTIDTACVTLFKAACDANGIKGTLSCLPWNFVDDVDLKNTLLSMEQEGFQTVIHAYSQIDAFNDPENNLATCESNLVQGMREMEAAGFLDYKYWVTPYCKDTEGVQSIARKWGMNCALAGGNTYEPADDTYGRYALRRAAFGPNDADSSITLAQLQGIAQEAAQNKGWLIIMTHFEAWRNAGGDYTRFTNLIDYLKGIGYEFMTVAEAWSYRRAIYDVYDMF